MVLVLTPMAFAISLRLIEIRKFNALIRKYMKIPLLVKVPSPAKERPTYYEGFLTCGLPYRLVFFFHNFYIQRFRIHVCQLVKQTFLFHNYKTICAEYPNSYPAWSI